jgi:hypothetical protein
LRTGWKAAPGKAFQAFIPEISGPEKAGLYNPAQ